MAIRMRIYETKTLVLLADFLETEYVPRVGEHVQIGPRLNDGDIHNSTETTRRVLNVVVEMWSKDRKQDHPCAHVEVDVGAKGHYLGVVFDASLAEPGRA
jgi:hypothetical protein